MSLSTPVDITQPLGQLRAYHDALPAEEQKTGVGQLLGYLVAAGGPLWGVGKTIFSAIQFDSLRAQSQWVHNALMSAYETDRASLLNAVTSAVQSPETRDEVMMVYDTWYAKNTTEIGAGAGPGKWDRLSTVELRWAVSDTIAKERQAMAGSIMKTSIISSTFVIALQTVQLYFTFNELRDADNVCKNGTQFTIIDAALVKLGAEVLALHRLVDANDWDKARFVYTRATKMYNNVNNAVSKLRIKVDGLLVSVGTARDHAFLNGCSNAVMATSSGVQGYSLWPWLSGPYQALAVAVTAGFAALAYGNYVAYTMSGERLSQLGQIQAKIDRLEAEVNQLDAEISAAEETIGLRAFTSQPIQIS